MIEAEMDKYNAEYFLTRQYGSDPARAAMYAQERARVEAKVPAGRILDYGCGVGDFLAGFAARQWERHGVDLAPYAVDQARARGLTAKVCTGALEYPEAFFEGVIMRGTLQHFYDPFLALREAARVLKPGGYLILLATPNARSLVYFLFGTLPALDPPRNWFIPSDKNLQTILVNLGFAVEEIKYPYWGTPYAKPGRDALRFIGRLLGFKRPFAFPGSMLEVYAKKQT